MNNLFNKFPGENAGKTYLLLDDSLRLIEGPSTLGNLFTRELIDAPRVDLTIVSTPYRKGIPINLATQLVEWKMPSSKNITAIFLVDYVNGNLNPVLRHVVDLKQASVVGFDLSKTTPDFTNPNNYKYGTPLTVITGDLMASLQLKNDLNDTEANTSQLETDLYLVNTSLQKINKDLKASKEINTSLMDLNNIIIETESLLNIVSIVPEIRPEVDVIKESITTIQKTVSQALSISNRIENIVKPIRTKTVQLQSGIKKFDTALLKLKAAELKSSKTLGAALTCVQKLPNNSAKSDLAKKLDAASLNISPKVLAFNATQLCLLNGISRAQSECQTIEQDVVSLASINIEINALIDKLTRFILPFNKLQGVFGHVFHLDLIVCHLSFSVDEILNDVSGLVNDFMAPLNKFLAPFIKDLDLKAVFSLPDMDVLSDLHLELEGLQVQVLNPMTSLIKEIDGFIIFEGELELLESKFSKLNTSCSGIGKS